MRDNGIEDYPDPQIGEDGGVMIASPLDVTTAGNEEVAAAQAACQHILEEAGPPGTAPAGSTPDGATPSGSSPAGESEWEKIVPGGDCVCADGSEFAFWERQADPTKVVFYLDGGGACTDATTCAFTGIERRVGLLQLERRGRGSGVPGGRDPGLLPGRQPLRRLLVHLRGVVHRGRRSR